MLISALQESDSVTHTRIYMYIFICFSIMVYHIMLKLDTLLYSRTLLYIIHSMYNSWHLLIPNSQFFPPYPLRNPGLFSMSVNLFLLDMFICVVLQSPYISNIVCYLSFPFSLISLGMIISRCIHVAADGIISFFFMPE